jgi:hypothetical protein
MTSTTRRLLGAVTAAVLALSAAVLGTNSAQAQEAGARAANTVLTVNVRSCEGCEVTLVSYLDGETGAGWASDPHTIQNGKAAFVVPTAKTEGLSVMVRTPWEGHTGYVTMVVFRYKGLAAGERIGFNRARTMKRGSGCWAGTTEKQASLRFKVRRVNVPGVHGKVPGNIAWAPTTQAWLPPMLPTYGGVLGAQDVIACKAA